MLVVVDERGGFQRLFLFALGEGLYSFVLGIAVLATIPFATRLFRSEQLLGVELHIVDYSAGM